VTAKVAVALFLAGALVALAGASWAHAAAETQLGAGGVMLAAILLLLGAHRRDRGES
jgi:hypothetical protein